MRRFEQWPRFGRLGAPGESGIALSGASAKVKPPNRAFQLGRKCVGTSDDVIKAVLHPFQSLPIGP